MYEITERYGFVATHQLHGLPDTHPCGGVHQHRWFVEVVLAPRRLLPSDGPSELALLEPVRRYIAEELDGRHLNDLLVGAATPVRLAEHLAMWCREELAPTMSRSLCAVVISADVNSRARYLFPRVAPDEVTRPGGEAGEPIR
jgi:6-pyruvoyltetrahydropterin/6-carboxytetrahydropterin synthase